MCPPFLLWKTIWRKYVVAIIVILLNHGANQTEGIAMLVTLIGNFICTGLYETYLGELWGGIPYDMRDKADNEIGKCAVDYINDALWTDVFPSDYDDDFEVTYTGTYHPKWYNFETDSTLFDFAYTDKLCEYMLGYAAMNRDKFVSGEFVLKIGKGNKIDIKD